jgi:cytochrome c oxidase cbb3-type subunit 2
MAQSSIYSKPVVFALLATAAIMVGTLAMMLLPMLSEEMHPKLEKLQPFTPLQLAGRDLYQREGCVNCHTQTVRPLKAETARYGEYSKAGEFAYDRPFLWGSKRTGPDLARVGGKYPDDWHSMHFDDPGSLAPQSNMPVYGWMKANAVDAASTEAHMQALGLPYTPDEIAGLAGKTEVDALVAYLQSLGHAVMEAPVAVAAEAMDEVNPMAGSGEAAHRGEEIYESNCSGCHGEFGSGGIGPKLTDTVWLGMDGEISDGALKAIIARGTKPGMEIAGRTAQGGMPSFKMGDDDIWSLVTFIRLIKGHE